VLARDKREEGSEVEWGGEEEEEGSILAGVRLEIEVAS